MIDFLKFIMVLYAVLLVQVTLIPAYITDPFKPNLLIVMVAYLGLREGGVVGAVRAFFLGLVADCFSGHHFGLHAFSFLAVHLLLRNVAGRLYTDSIYLIVLVVFVATVVNASIHLLLLLLFSVAQGIYITLLAGLLPQALVNSLAASLLCWVPYLGKHEAS